jgi:transcriptional regulator with XRE-family HTH domain
MAKSPQDGPDPIDVAVGARIKIRRAEQGLSQLELGTRMGLSPQQIQKYEGGLNRISASMLVRAARALDCPATQLLGQAQENAPDAELLALLAMNGAVELLRLFAQIPDADTRNSLLSITRGIVRGGARRAG